MYSAKWFRVTVIISVALFFAFSSTSCITVTPVNNIVNLENTDFSHLDKFKTGEDCTTFLLWVIPFGTTSLIKAIRDAHVSKVKIVDYEERYFYLFNQYCVVVYGS